MCQRSPLRRYFDESAARAGSLVGDNEPHSVTDASDYAIPVRGEQRGLHHVAIEIRRTLSLTKRFSASGQDSSRDCCRKHINESSPSLKPQTSFIHHKRSPAFRQAALHSLVRVRQSSCATRPSTGGTRSPWPKFIRRKVASTPGLPGARCGARLRSHRPIRVLDA
jgi:hypothetical protein